jgi:hypothetical protein
LERPNKFYFHSIVPGENGFKHLWTKEPIDAQIDKKVIQKTFRKSKQK